MALEVSPLMTNQRTTNQTPKPSLDLTLEQREAAKRLRGSDGPAADLADVLIQLDDASESESASFASSSLAI